MSSTQDALRDTVAIVTGATSGLGRAVAVRLASTGAHVALIGRNEQDLQQTADGVASLGVRAFPLKADYADTTSLGELVERAASEVGDVSVLVNAAATDVPGSAEALSIADWERDRSELDGAGRDEPRSDAPHASTWRRSRRQHLLRCRAPRVGERLGVLSTKFALTGLTQSLAAEGRHDGIRVCVLHPGAMSTSWGSFDPTQRGGGGTQVADERDSLDPAVVADLIAWMATARGQPVLNEVTMTPLQEAGWP